MAGTVLRWQDQGACKGQTATMFPETEDGVRKAKAICATCDVVSECLASALATNEEYGVWGGYSAADRRYMKRGPKPQPSGHNCGTRSGYVTHRSRNEEPCGPCTEANRRYAAERRVIAKAIARQIPTPRRK